MLLGLDLMLELIDFALLDLSFLDFGDHIFDSFEAGLQIFEDLVSHNLILRILRVLLKFLFALLQLRLHHFNLGFQVADFFNLLSLGLLDGHLLGCYDFLDRLNTFFQLLQLFFFLLLHGIIVLFLLCHFDLAQLIDSLPFFFKLSDLPLFLIKLKLQCVSFSLLPCSGCFDVSQFVSTGFHNAL